MYTHQTLILRITANYGRYCTSGVCVPSGEEEAVVEKEEGEVV